MLRRHLKRAFNQISTMTPSEAIRTGYRTGRVLLPYYKAYKRRRYGGPKRGGAENSNKKVGRSSNSTRKGAKRVPYALRKRSKGAKKHVKVSKTLKKQIKSVVDNSNKADGTYICVPRITGERIETDHRKTFVLYPFAKNSSGTNPGNDVSGCVHSWNRIVDEVSKLWNVKGATEFPVLGDSQNFPSQKQMTVEIKYAKIKYWIKNNSDRTYYVSLWKYTSKQNIGGSYNPNTIFAGSVTTENQVVNPSALNPTVEGFSVTSTDSGRRIETEWPNSPKYYQQMRSYYDIEEVKMVLDPGQVVEQSINLPVGKFSGWDYFIDGSYQTSHKGAVFTGFSFYPDNLQSQASSTTGTIGEIGAFTDPSHSGINTVPQGALIFESKIVRKYCMVDCAGFAATGSTTALNMQELNFRNPKTFFEQFVNTEPDSNLSSVRHEDAQNPNTTFQ